MGSREFNKREMHSRARLRCFKTADHLPADSMPRPSGAWGLTLTVLETVVHAWASWMRTKYFVDVPDF